MGDTRSSSYLEDYWRCHDVFSVVNVIGTQLRNLINSGLCQRMAYGGYDGNRSGGRNGVPYLSEHQIQTGYGK